MTTIPKFNVGFNELSTSTSRRETDNVLEKYKEQYKTRVSLAYPDDLRDRGQEAFVVFHIVEPVKLFGTGKAPITKKALALYLPPTLKVSYGTTYEEIESSVKGLAAFAGFGARAGSKLSPGNMAKIFGAAGSGSLDPLASLATSTAREAIMTGAGILDQVTSADLRRQAEIQQGRLINPHMAVAFTGVNFREFSFDFQMMARSAQESIVIREIIRTFKKAMHPSLEGGGLGRYWLYPDNFRITFHTPTEGKQYMFQIDTCALTSVDVDYAGSGVPSFFSRSGAPVDVRMSLKFKELRVLTSEDFTDDKNY